MRQADWLLHDCIIWWAARAAKAWLQSTVAIYTNYLTNYAAAALTLKSIVDCGEATQKDEVRKRPE